MNSIPANPEDFDSRWRGQWIWLPEETHGPEGFWTPGIDPNAAESHALFRTRFDLGDVPERAPARITADSRYVLHVNGKEVARGPVRGQPRRLHYDLIDLAPHLRSGSNVVAVYVKYYGVANAFWMPPVPNSKLGRRGVLVFEADLGERGWIVSDDTWRTVRTDAWDSGWRQLVDHDPGVPLELFDARRFPHGWTRVDFDDAGWGGAETVPAMHIGGFARAHPPTDPYGPLYPRPIAFLEGERRVPTETRVERLEGPVDLAIANPSMRVRATLDQAVASHEEFVAWPLTIEVSENGPARISLDMGGVVSGMVGFAIDAPRGTVLDIAYSEEPLRPSVGMDAMRIGTRYVARGQEDVFRMFESTGARFVTILVHSTEGSVTLASFDVLERLYPWEGGASFACSDEELQSIFDAGVRSVALCSHDAFIDCPSREQRSWVGDAVVHQMVHYATNPDWRLARHFLSLADSPRSDGILPMSVAGDIEARHGFTIPDWSLHWGHALYNLYRFEGDRERLKKHMPSFERVLRWYAPYQLPNGLLKDVPEWNLVDWSSVSTGDTSSLLASLWARGLREYAEMAAWLDERGSQRWAEELYERIRSGFEVFWDESRGSYVDHVVDGARRPEMSQLAGALAVASGLAPHDRWQRIVDTVTDPDRLVVRSWVGGGDGNQSWEKWRAQVEEGRYEIDWDVEREIVLAEPFMSYVVHDAVALAGRTDRLPDMYRRWSQFLEDGYDSFGECWDFGTHSHGWSSTPTRDLVFYTLGVTPAEPGYATARVAPRLGSLAWAKGTIPTPHGPITLEADADAVTIDSPVPVTLDLPGQPAWALQAGRHRVEVAIMGQGAV